MLREAGIGSEIISEIENSETDSEIEKMTRFAKLYQVLLIVPCP
jgi:hypothetical protein